MCDATERHDCSEVRHFGDGRLEEIAALPDLLADGLVFRRHAAHRIGDARIDKGQAIVRPRRIFAHGEAVARERFVQQIARIVAGERATGAVRALQPRREPDDQQSRHHRSEGGNRGVVPSWLPAPPGLAKRDEARATRTILADFGVDQLRCTGGGAVDRHEAPISVLVELIVIDDADWGARGGWSALQELRGVLSRLPRLAGWTIDAFARVAADFRL